MEEVEEGEEPVIFKSYPVVLARRGKQRSNQASNT